MAPRHVTARGLPFDMSRLREQNAHKPALGNANSNARGDIIDKRGTILKTQEQITAEWAAAKRQRDASVRPANIKSDSLIPDTMSKHKKPVKQTDVVDKDFDPGPLTTTVPADSNKSVPTPSRRKITETDN